MAGTARFSLVALDCPDPQTLAAFYAGITGWEVDYGGGSWVQLRSDGGATIAFQHAPDHVPPAWPSRDRPQQAHLDFDVPDLVAADEQVLADTLADDFRPGRPDAHRAVRAPVREDRNRKLSDVAPAVVAGLLSAD